MNKKIDFMPSTNFKLVSRIEDSINFSSLLKFMNSAIVIPGLEKGKNRHLTERERKKSCNINILLEQTYCNLICKTECQVCYSLHGS